MRCNEIRLLISEYFDDELSDLQKQTVEEHIMVCGRCYQEFVEMRELVGLLKRSLSPFKSTKEDLAGIVNRFRN